VYHLRGTQLVGGSRVASRQRYHGWYVGALTSRLVCGVGSIQKCLVSTMAMVSRSQQSQLTTTGPSIYGQLPSRCATHLSPAASVSLRANVRLIRSRPPPSLSTCTQKDLRIHTYAHTHTCTHTHTHTHAHTHTHTHYAHTHTYTRTHIHAHTHIRSSFLSA